MQEHGGVHEEDRAKERGGRDESSLLGRRRDAGAPGYRKRLPAEDQNHDAKK